MGRDEECLSESSEPGQYILAPSFLQFYHALVECGYGERIESDHIVWMKTGLKETW